MDEDVDAGGALAGDMGEVLAEDGALPVEVVEVLGGEGLFRAAIGGDGADAGAGATMAADGHGGSPVAGTGEL